MGREVEPVGWRQRGRSMFALNQSLATGNAIIAMKKELCSHQTLLPLSTQQGEPCFEFWHPFSDHMLVMICNFIGAEGQQRSHELY